MNGATAAGVEWPATDAEPEGCPVIPDDTVEEVRLRADLVEIIGESVKLFRAGKDWKGKCPFHDDRTPSFFVVPDKGFYKCFGCGESGNIFSFLMKQGGMDFLDAVRALAARYGIELREETGSREDDPRRPLYEANAFAKAWFRENLEARETGTVARAYLEARGIDAPTAERFALGWVPDERTGLSEAAKKHGLPAEHLLEVGLVLESRRSKAPYDRFRGRIIFPIESIDGRVVGFGGRVLDGGGKGVPKYMNSPESPVYRKGSVLYGLGGNRNAIRRAGVALVVEGYMDVVALGAGGVEGAVATLGTSMTDEHARLLARYTKKAILLFDSDRAGHRATFRAGDALLAHGVHASVATLPAGEDPDTVIRAEGKEGLGRYLDAAVDLLDRKLQLLDEKGYLTRADRIRTAVDKLLPTLRAVRDPALRDIYTARAAERTGVRRKTLEAEMAKGTDVPVRPHDAPPPLPAPGAGEGSRRRPVLTERDAERQLLVILLRSREWIDRALERVGPGEFRNLTCRAIFEALTEDPELKPPLEGASPEVQVMLERLLDDPGEMEHPERVFSDCLLELEDRALQAEHDGLGQALRAASSDDEKREILRRVDELRRSRRGRWNVVRGKALRPASLEQGE